MGFLGPLEQSAFLPCFHSLQIDVLDWKVLFQRHRMMNPSSIVTYDTCDCWYNTGVWQPILVSQEVTELFFHICRNGGPCGLRSFSHLPILSLDWSNQAFNSIAYHAMYDIHTDETLCRPGYRFATNDIRWKVEKKLTLPTAKGREFLKHRNVCHMRQSIYNPLQPLRAPVGIPGGHRNSF